MVQEECHVARLQVTRWAKLPRGENLGNPLTGLSHMRTEARDRPSWHPPKRRSASLADTGECSKHQQIASEHPLTVAGFSHPVAVAVAFGMCAGRQWRFTSTSERTRDFSVPLQVV